jgi:hypothetical protein
VTDGARFNILDHGNRQQASEASKIYVWQVTTLVVQHGGRIWIEEVIFRIKLTQTLDCMAAISKLSSRLQPGCLDAIPDHLRQV